MIFVAILLLIAGFVALVKGADVFVDGAASLQEPPFFHHLPDLPATPFGLVEGPYPESPPDVRFENHFSL